MNTKPHGKIPCRDWLETLDRAVRAQIQARVLRVETGNLGDHKSAGGGVQEARVPEREDGLSAQALDLGKMAEPIGAPAQRSPEQANQRRPDGRDNARLKALRPGRTPIARSARQIQAYLPNLSPVSYMPSYCGPPPPSGGTHVMT